MTTDTLTQRDPHALDAEGLAPNGNWIVVLAPNGEITIARTPPIDSPQDEMIAFFRDAFGNIPPGASPQCLCMSRGDGAGSLSLNVTEGASPPREQLTKLCPLVLSRWAARVHSYGETRFEENFPGLFGLKDQPVIVRSGPAIGRELAASCVGKMIFYSVRPDELRAGGSDIVDFAGFIESAECDAHGVVASLMILSPALHLDLEDLERRGELESARLCLVYSARATPRRTAWGLKVVDLTHALASRLNVISLAHSPGTHIVRRLAIDEPLKPDDFRPTQWLHVPRNLAVVPTEAEATATIDPGAVGTGNIAIDALTKNAYFDPFHGAEQIFSGSEVTLCSVTVTTNGGHVKVHFKAVLASFVGTPNTITFKLYKGNLGGTLLDTSPEIAAVHSASMLARDTSPAGSQAYTVGAQVSGGINEAVTVDNIRLFAENTKATT